MAALTGGLTGQKDVSTIWQEPADLWSYGGVEHGWQEVGNGEMRVQLHSSGQPGLFLEDGKRQIKHLDFTFGNVSRLCAPWTIPR